MRAMPWVSLSREPWRDQRASLVLKVLRASLSLLCVIKLWAKTGGQNVSRLLNEVISATHFPYVIGVMMTNHWGVISLQTTSHLWKLDHVHCQHHKCNAVRCWACYGNMLSMQLLGLFAQRLPDNAYALVSNGCDALGTTSHAVNVGLCNVQVLWTDQTWKV